MGSDGLGTQAQDGSQDPRLRWQDGLVTCYQTRPWLSYGIMIMKFSFICISIVFLVLIAFCSALAFVFSSLIPFITREPPKFSPLFLTALLGFTLLPFRFKISGVLCLAVHYLCCPFFVQSLPIAALFGACLVLPCISSVVLFIPFLSIHEGGWSMSVFCGGDLSSWYIHRDHVCGLSPIAKLYTSSPQPLCT